MKWLFVILWAEILGLLVMLVNFVERPNNDSGKSRFVGGQREYNARWPKEMERLNKMSLREIGRLGQGAKMHMRAVRTDRGLLYATLVGALIWGAFFYAVFS